MSQPPLLSSPQCVQYAYFGQINYDNEDDDDDDDDTTGKNLGFFGNSL